jgi:hypothetical protein
MGKKFTLSLLVFAATLLALPIQAQTTLTAKKALVSNKFQGAKSHESKKVYSLASLRQAQTLKEALSEAKLAAREKAEVERVEFDKLWTNNMSRVQERNFSCLKTNVEALNGRQILAGASFKGSIAASRRAEQTDAYGVIVTPGEGESKMYDRAGYGYYVSNQQLYYGAQSGKMEVVETADGTVYFKDFISNAAVNTWIKGTKSGNTITIAAGQVVTYMASYGYGLYIAKTAYDETNGWVKVDGDITLTVDGNTITLEGTDQTHPVSLFYTDDNTFSGYGDYSSVFTYDENYVAPSLVELPEGAVVNTWYNYGTQVKSSGEAEYQATAKVAFVGDEVYLSGVFANFPDSWIKGTINGTTVTFSGTQYVGAYASYNIYGVGANGLTASSTLEDFKMTYDAQAKTLKSVNTLLANASEEEIYFLEAYKDIVISESEPVVEEPTATTGAPVDVLPYENGLNTADAFADFGVIDSNKDKKTWSFSSSVGAVGYSYSTANDGDDWLVSPAVKLEGGKKYHFAIDVAAASAKYPERIEVKLGTEPKASALTAAVIPATVIDFADFTTLENNEVVVAETGYYHFGIHAISDADQYNLYVKNFLIEAGVDPAAPAAVTNFDVVPTENKLEATVSFTAPSLTSGGETLTSLTKVDVIRDKAVIASLTDVVPGAQVQYVDNDNLSMGNHTYQVIAYNEYGAGVKSDVKTVLVSASLNVPVTIDFASADIFNLFTVIDANDDDATWGWNVNYGAYYLYAEDAADDYLISPAVNFEAGKNYKIVVNANCVSDSYPEKFRVLVGKTASVEGLTQEVLATTVVDVKDPTDFEAEFAIAESGQYYVAIQAVSDADMYRLNIHKISIEKGAEPTAPAAVTDFSVIPGLKGANWALVKFNAPAVAVNGSALAENMTIDVLRNGEVIKTFEDVAPSVMTSFKDETAATGFNTYQIVASNTSGAGLKSEKITVYVGFDIPDAVAEVKTVDLGNKIELSWEPVSSKGLNGGYVDPNQVDYLVYGVEYEEYWGMLFPVRGELLDSVRNNTFSQIDFNTNEGEQGYTEFLVVTKNEVGEGGETNAALWTGAPYELPWSENFAGKSFHSMFDYNNLSLYISEDASDEDGIALKAMAEEEAGAAFLATGKIDMKGAANPTLLFDVKNFAAASTLSIVGQKSDGTLATLLDNVAGTSTEYTTVKVSLAGVKDNKYNRFYFNFNFGNLTDSILLDNIKIVDLYEHDVEVSLKAPASVVAGNTANLKMTVANNAENAANGFTLKLTANNKEIYNKTFNEALKAFSSIDVDAEFKTTVFDEAGDVTLKAEIVYGNDLNPDNNEDEAVITVKEPTVAAPSDLAAVQSADNTVTLTWNAPAAGAPAEVTEGFDNEAVFVPFSIGGITAEQHTGAFGDWSLYDGNGIHVYGFQNTSFENASEVQAWQVANPSKISASFAETYPAHSGDQFLWSFCPADQDENGNDIMPAADHWLISPELTGAAQTISFYARAITAQYGAETFEVLASSTDTNPSSFTIVGSAYSTEETEWTAYSAELPAGTKFFAIRHTAQDIFGLLVDDVTYSVGSVAPASFNIYVDAAAAGTATETTAELKNLAYGNHVFAVTAVYANGAESKPVTATLDVVNAINEILNSGKSFTIYTVDGKLINRQATSLKDLKGAYIINNKKVILK